MTEREILRHELTRQSAARYIAFLQTELAQLPDWHELHRDYSDQLAELGRRQLMGPRSLPAVTT